MGKYIYKIENLINHKIYIGQTNDYKRRFLEHKNKGYKKETKVLYYAFDKYGIENFDFSIIEFVENYNEREKYWIKYYDSFENGYNMTEGGDEPPTFHGENHPLSTHNIADIEKIIFLLKNTKTSIKDISKITNYNTSSINRINKGELWYQKDLTYPIRKQGTLLEKQERIKNIQNDLLNTNLTQKQIGEKYGVGRTTVTAINNGQNGYNSTLDYPLRK